GKGLLPASTVKRDNEIHHATFSPDGRRVLTVGSDGQIKLWDANSGQQVIASPRHDVGVWAAAFTPDGRGVVTAGEDRTMRAWDVAGGLPVHPPFEHPEDLRDVGGFNSDRTFYTVSGEIRPDKGQKEMLRVW